MTNPTPPDEVWLTFRYKDFKRNPRCKGSSSYIADASDGRGEDDDEPYIHKATHEEAIAKARREELLRVCELSEKAAAGGETLFMFSVTVRRLFDAEAPALVTCQDCMGTGISGHPDSGQTCDRCGGDGAEAPARTGDLMEDAARHAAANPMPAQAKPKPSVQEAARVLLEAYAHTETCATYAAAREFPQMGFINAGAVVGAALRALAGGDSDE